MCHLVVVFAMTSISRSTTLKVVRLPQPTGLQIVDPDSQVFDLFSLNSNDDIPYDSEATSNDAVCFLKKYCAEVPRKYKQVFEIKDVLSKFDCAHIINCAEQQALLNG